jgi:hypothetical protein
MVLVQIGPENMYRFIATASLKPIPTKPDRTIDDIEHVLSEALRMRRGCDLELLPNDEQVVIRFRIPAFDDDSAKRRGKNVVRQAFPPRFEYGLDDQPTSS